MNELVFFNFCVSWRKWWKKTGAVQAFMILNKTNTLKIITFSREKISKIFVLISQKIKKRPRNEGKEVVCFSEVGILFWQKLGSSFFGNTNFSLSYTFLLLWDLPSMHSNITTSTTHLYLYTSSNLSPSHPIKGLFFNARNLNPHHIIIYSTVSWLSMQCKLILKFKLKQKKK